MALERAAWQQPMEVSASGDSAVKLKEAETKAVELIEQIRQRGCTETFIPNPEALAKGQARIHISYEKSCSPLGRFDIGRKHKRRGNGRKKSKDGSYFQSNAIWKGHCQRRRN